MVTRPASTAEAAIHRLVLWNVDLTLVDVTRVMREAYAETFRRVTGRPLVRLPQFAGRSESEIFFDALALNGVDLSDQGMSERLLGPLQDELATALEARRDTMREQGRALPGAADALGAVGALDGVVQTVLTGSSKPNAVLKLRCFGLDRFLDPPVGVYGSEPYPKGALLRVTKLRAEDRYGVSYPDSACVYIADSVRDVGAARNGGARCLAVASGRATPAELRAAGADVVLSGLSGAAVVAETVEHLTNGRPGS